MIAMLREGTLQSAFLLRGRKSCSTAWNGWAGSLSAPAYLPLRHSHWK